MAQAAAPVIELRPLAVSSAARAALSRGAARLRAIYRHGASLAVDGEDDEIFLGAPGHGLLPVHVIVRSRDFARVVEASRAHEGRGDGERLALRLDIARSRAFRLRLAPDPSAAGAAGFRTNLEASARWLRGRREPLGLGVGAAELLEPGGDLQRRLCAARGDAAAAADALRGLVGRGAGSTPAGDDLIVGAAAHGWLSQGGESPVVRAIASLSCELDALTTLTGATYLRAAARGEFGSHLLAWVRALRHASSDRALVLASRVAGHGATSGLDTLAGFIAAAQGASAACPGSTGTR